MMNRIATCFLIVIAATTFSCKDAPAVIIENEIDTEKDLPPNERFGELFEQVQLNKVFPDGKTFVDCTPKFSTKRIMSNYKSDKGSADFNLKEFVLANFETPIQYASGFEADTNTV